MTRMFIRHQVSDFDTWKKAYEAFAPTQQRLGVTGKSAHRSIDDPREVTVVHDFADAETARAFADNDEVAQAMGEAGVAGPPDIWFADTV